MDISAGSTNNESQTGIENGGKRLDQRSKSVGFRNWITSQPFLKSLAARRTEKSALQSLELGNDLLHESEWNGDMGGITAAVALVRQGVDKLPLSSSHYPRALIGLANALSVRLELGGGQQKDHEEVVSLYRQALDLSPESSDFYSISLNNLAIALLNKFKQGNAELCDLEECVSLFRKTLELYPFPHHGHCTSLINLAHTLMVRFEHGAGHKSDLEEVVSLYRRALDLRAVPDPNRFKSLDDLANALSSRFQQGDRPKTDLEEIYSLHRQALELCPASYSGRPALLNNIAKALTTRFEQGYGQQEDLEEVIALYRKAIEICPKFYPGRSTYLCNLAVALQNRYDQGGGHRSDFEEIVLLHKEALERRPESHPDRGSSLNNFATALLTRFGHGGGRQSDLEEAILLQRQAVELLPEPHPDRPVSLSNLATAILTRLEQGGGHHNDLGEVVSLHRQALALRPESHPDRSVSLNNLASALSIPFGPGGGQRSDLEEIISLRRQSLEVCHETHPERSLALANLASALLDRLKGDIEHQDDFEIIISLHLQALELRPGPHPSRHISLNNYAEALLTRYEQGGNHLSDLQECISVNRQALKLCRAGHSARFTSLGNLAHALSVRLQQDRQPSDLEEMISIYRQITHLPFHHASRCFGAALRWIRDAVRHQDPSVIEAYDVALGVLPQLAALSLDIQSRQNALSAGSDGLAREAARYAIQSGKLEKAVEYLENGRAVFWSQAMHLRSPLDHLCDQAPDLGRRLRFIAAALERGSHRESPIGNFTNQQRMTLEEETSRFARLDQEWSDGLEQARKIPGFEDFLLPRRLSSLQVAAEVSPIAILIANDAGSDCLILTSSVIHHIPIPNLPNVTLRKLVRLISVAASGSAVQRSAVQEISEFLSRDTAVDLIDANLDRGGRLVGTQEVSSDEAFKRVLKVLWDEIVKPIVDFLGVQKYLNSSDMPVLQWCPTGLFTFLPVHAAGSYGSTSPSSESSSEYFISSYTPTISALLSQSSSSSPPPFSMMAVIQAQSLPSTLIELEKIKRHVPDQSLVVFGVPGANKISVETVASRLSDATIVHFACHGIQNSANPLESGLKIEGELLTIARIMKEEMVNGSLAFLGACETAKGDRNVPDEAMNLGAGLIFSGFRRVIATMWEIRDADGPIIADAFYEELYVGPDGKPTPQPDCTKSAPALHIAVKKLRSESAPFHRWVPFIHIGL